MKYLHWDFYIPSKKKILKEQGKRRIGIKNKVTNWQPNILFRNETKFLKKLFLHELSNFSLCRRQPVKKCSAIFACMGSGTITLLPSEMLLLLCLAENYLSLSTIPIHFRITVLRWKFIERCEFYLIDTCYSVLYRHLADKNCSFCVFVSKANILNYSLIFKLIFHWT